MKNKIIIIGAGPAGLTAGYELLKNNKDFEVLILEENSQVGGISKTINCQGNRMDLGGHRFFSKNSQVMEWWTNILPLQGSPSYDDKILQRETSLVEGGPDPEKEDRVFLFRQRVSRIYYKHKFFDYPVKMNFATIKNLGFFTTLVAGFSYIKAAIFKRKENSLEDFYINRFGKKLYSIFFEGYTEKLWGRHPKDISPDWGAQRVKGLSIKAVLKDIFGKILPGKKREVETSLIEAFYYPKHGPGQLWEIVAEEIKAMRRQILLNSKVEKVHVEDKKIKAVTYKSMKDSKECLYTTEADQFISSMPLSDLVKEVEDEKVFSDEAKTVAKGLPYRDFVTVGLLMDKLALKNETNIKTLGDIVPDCWIYVQDAGIKMGRIQLFNNWSPYMVNSPENTVFCGLEYFCTEGDSFWNMEASKWEELAKSELIKMGVIKEDVQIYDFHVEKVKKAYPAYFDTYKDINKLQNEVNDIQNLYCVGRNGQHRYNNMDHSMLTAFETVKAIETGKIDKKTIWDINVEKKYHEEKE